MEAHRLRFFFGKMKLAVNHHFGFQLPEDSKRKLKSNVILIMIEILMIGVMTARVVDQLKLKPTENRDAEEHLLQNTSKHQL